jgi:hypothetical protein
LVGEVDYCVTLAAEDGVSFFVMSVFFWCFMYAAVGLDDQPVFIAIEIHDEVTDLMLASEFQAKKPSPSQ